METTAAAAKKLLNDNPVIKARLMVTIETAIERYTARELGISPRMARALLRSTGRM